jgi:hypothetical protein
MKRRQIKEKESNQRKDDTQFAMRAATRAVGDEVDTVRMYRGDIKNVSSKEVECYRTDAIELTEEIGSRIYF